MIPRDQKASVVFCLEAALEIVTSVEQALQLEPGALGHGVRAAATFTATIVLFIGMCHCSGGEDIREAEDRVMRGIQLLQWVFALSSLPTLVQAHVDSAGCYLVPIRFTAEACCCSTCCYKTDRSDRVSGQSCPHSRWSRYITTSMTKTRG